MKGFKCDIILKNEIENQPPFGFSMLIIDEGHQLHRAVLMGKIAERIQITEFDISKEDPIDILYQWDSLLPVGCHPRFREPKKTIKLTLRDRVTGESIQITQLWDSWTITDYDSSEQNGNSEPDFTANLIELINQPPAVTP